MAPMTQKALRGREEACWAAKWADSFLSITLSEFASASWNSEGEGTTSATRPETSLKGRVREAKQPLLNAKNEQSKILTRRLLFFLIFAETYRNALFNVLEFFAHNRIGYAARHKLRLFFSRLFGGDRHALLAVFVFYLVLFVELLIFLQVMNFDGFLG